MTTKQLVVASPYHYEKGFDKVHVSLTHYIDLKKALMKWDLSGVWVQYNSEPLYAMVEKLNYNPDTQEATVEIYCKLNPTVTDKKLFSITTVIDLSLNIEDEDDFPF